MNDHPSMQPSARTCLALGSLLCILIVVSCLAGNIFIGIGLAVAGGLGTWYAATRSNAPLQRLYESLARMNSDHNSFLMDDVLSWKELGPLGKEASEALSFNMTRREYYRSAILAVGTPFFICNKDGIITHASHSFTSILDKTGKDIIGKTVSQAIYNKNGASLTEKALREKGTINVEHDMTLWNGRPALLLLLGQHLSRPSR